MYVCNTTWMLLTSASHLHALQAIIINWTMNATLIPMLYLCSINQASFEFNHSGTTTPGTKATVHKTWTATSFWRTTDLFPPQTVNFSAQCCLRSRFQQIYFCLWVPIELLMLPLSFLTETGCPSHCSKPLQYLLCPQILQCSWKVHAEPIHNQF